MLTQRKALALVTFVMLCFALFNQNWTRPVTRPLSNVIKATQFPAGWMASKLKTDPIVNYPDATDQEIRELLADAQAANEALWEENDRLKEEIAGFNALRAARPLDSIRMVVAPVSRFNDSPTNPTIELLRGSLHGLKQDDPVAFRSNLIGFVTDDIGPANATVELVTRPGFSIGVSIKPPTKPGQELGEGWPFKTRVTSDGRGGFYCDLNKSITKNLRPGDLVRIGDSIRDAANGLLLGEIKEIQTGVGERPLLEDRVIIQPRSPIGPQSKVTILTEDSD